MTRETRINLIVLGVLVVGMAPGAVILFNKKYDPTARPMNQPDFVKRHMVFIDPTPAPPTIRRMMPAVTAAWVNDLARQRVGVGMMTVTEPGHVGDEGQAQGRALPVMSERRLAQVVSVREFADGFDLALLVWNLPRGTRSASLRLGLVSDDATATTTTTTTTNEPSVAPTIQVTSSELMPVPAAIKRDLQYSGYPSPPQQALWAVARVNFPENHPIPTTLSVSITCDADGAILSDVATFAPSFPPPPAPRATSP